MSYDRPENQSANTSSTSARPACSTSMHDNVETWEDCCVCEPEPRWQALAEELEADAARRSEHRSGDQRKNEE